ncbi:MAG: hypothetical protein ACLFVC_03360 [Opitutales bacterium]
MKSFALLSSLLLLPVLASGQTILVTAKVLDRAADGAAIRGQFKYPTVELESGESASLHIGEDLRYPVWMEKVESEDGVTEDQLVYEETPVGLVLGLKVAADGETIVYSGKTVSTVVQTVSETGSGLSSTEVTFLGKVEDGEMITVNLVGPDDTPEELSLHFALKE